MNDSQFFIKPIGHTLTGISKQARLSSPIKYTGYLILSVTSNKVLMMDIVWSNLPPKAPNATRQSTCKGKVISVTVTTSHLNISLASELANLKNVKTGYKLCAI